MTTDAQPDGEHGPARDGQHMAYVDPPYRRTAQPLGWQDETLDHGPRVRRVMRVLIAAVDAWRGERRDWRQGAGW